MSDVASTAIASPRVAAALEVTGVSAGYGRHRVLHECSLRVGPGQTVVLLGHNGAGKSTLLRAIMGLKRPSAGTISFDGRDYRRQPPAERARAGLALVPDVSRGGVFAGMSVRDNLALASDLARGAGPEISDDALRELFPPIYEKWHQPAQELSGGQRQMVAIAIALKRRPRVLLLDEPSVGLAPPLVRDVMDATQRVARDYGVGVLLVEQNVGAAARIADRIEILKNGGIVRTFEAAAMPPVHDLWEWF